MIEKENVLKFMQYIEKLAKVYEFNIPYGSYDIYAFAKDLLVWLENQSEQKPRGKSALEAIKEEKVDNANKVEPKFKVGDRVRHKKTNKDDVYEISKVYDDSYGIAGFTWMIYMKYQDQYELVSNKFDPKTLKPFDKVLVRDSCEHKWGCALYSHTIGGENSSYRYITDNSAYEYCIPYNDDTKYLLGTRKEAPEYYKYWED